jgi:hypothetical protein
MVISVSSRPVLPLVFELPPQALKVAASVNKTAIIKVRRTEFFLPGFLSFGHITNSHG